MSFCRASLIALACLALMAALAACGGSGSSTSSSASSTMPQPAASTAGATKAQAGRTASSGDSKSAASSGSSGGSSSSSSPGAANHSGAAGHPAPAPNLARRKAVIARRRLEHKAGAAAPFLVPQGDNSIPTYGSEASGSQRSAAEQALSGYLSARAAGDWSSACANLGAQIQKQLQLLAGGSGGNESCAAAYAKLSARIPASERANPLSGNLAALRVEGDKAFALFYGPHEQQYMIPMVSEAGAWRANQLEPIPWPIGPASP